MTPCSQLKVSRRFGKKYGLYLQGRRIRQAKKKKDEPVSKLQANFLLGSLFDPKDGGDMFIRRRLTFNGLHGVISQKIEL
jgi:hypothetical protein